MNEVKEMIQLNRSQENIVKEAISWYRNSSEQVFQFSGPPGSGKSVVLNAIIDALGIPRNRVAPMSYIGAAAIVMRLKGFHNAKTMHAWYYRPVDDILLDANGNILMDTYYNRPVQGMKFEKKPLDPEIELIVIDEAPSVPRSHKNTIEEAGKKIIAAGDLDQLPPVEDEPAYLYTGKVHYLNEIMRQAANSPIIWLSQRALRNEPIHTGYYGNQVWVTEEDQIPREFLLSADMILCGKNATRDRLNTFIRQGLLGVDSTLPIYGDKVVCRKNNWNVAVDGINLANGVVGSVMNNPDQSTFDGKIFQMDFKPNMLRSSFRGVECDYKYFVAPHEERQILRASKFSKGEKFEFAYATTTHMAQGSQYSKGIYFEEYINPSINNRLNYVGPSRFVDALIYVKQKKRFY